MLYVAAWSASQHNKACKECYQRLRGKGKSGKVAMIAVANNEVFFSIPWGHHRIIIDKFSDNPIIALFYARKVVEEGWSRNVLKSFIDTSLHLRQGKALMSFSRLLPAPDSDLAQELTKDPYIFDFTEMTEPYKERELKKALMNNLARFLLKLGSGFAT